MRFIGLAFVLVLAAGCEERMLTEGDCALIKDRLERAWTRDAVAAQRLADTNSFQGFIRDEGDRIGDAWMAQCELMVGKPVNDEAVECLRKVQTIDDVYDCSPQK